MHAFLAKFAVFNPKGIIAMQQKELIITAVLLMLIITIPFLIMVFVITRKYSANNKNTPDPIPESKNPPAISWWLFISAIILILSVINWKSTHALDPYKPIESNAKPITIQVVALEWKWLFIYPEQDIATVNFIQVPKNTPIHFVLTSDAAMNSFWVPELGGQIYAMSGMSTQLNLMATAEGDFRGSAAEINGSGYSGMTFIVRSSSQDAFNQWVQSAKASSRYLSKSEYEILAKPSKKNEPVIYSGSEPHLYDDIVMKYMSPDYKSVPSDMTGMDHAMHE